MELKEALLDLLFPPLCLYCGEAITSQKHPLCPSCLQQLTLIEPLGRCLSCFCSLDDEEEKRCPKCPIKGFRAAAACEYIGPAVSLMHAFKYGGERHFGKAMAALMATQLLRLEWPLPDLITFVPQTLAHRIMRGYNQSAVLAEELSEIVQKPSVSLLKRRQGDFSQSGLNREQRLQLKQSTFSWKQPSDIADQIVLLIDDVSTTKSTLMHCAALLHEGFPKKIYALTFCQA